MIVTKANIRLSHRNVSKIDANFYTHTFSWKLKTVSAKR